MARLSCALLLTINLFAIAFAQPTVYLIRHGEKPDSGNGLSAKGLQRAQCLRKVFGASSKYSIGYIMAQKYKPDGARKRPYDTVVPLAQDLGLTVDVSCDRDDPECVSEFVDGYKGSGNILISWQHEAMHDISKELGAGKKAPDYPDERFDLIWTQAYPWKEVSISSEECPGLDV